MQELVKVTTDSSGKRVVNAKELHQFLESKQDFSNWIAKRIAKYDFQEGKDFTIFLLKSTGGRPSKEYAITLNMAKELSMVENNDRGKEARQYFIQMEQRVLQQQKSLTPAELLLQNAQALVSMEREQERQRIEIQNIKAQIATRDENYFSVAGFAQLRGVKMDVTKANMIGRQCATLSRKYDYHIGKLHDSRYGQVNNYHIDILSTVFDNL